MVSAAKMAMWHPTNAKHVRKGHAWTCCYCTLVLPVCISTGLAYIWNLRKVVGICSVLPQNLAPGVQETLKFKNVEIAANNIKQYSDYGLNQCTTTSTRSQKCAGELPWTGTSQSAYWTQGVQEVLDTQLGSVHQVTTDPYLSIGVLEDLGHHITTVTTLLANATGLEECIVAGPAWCGISDAADGMLALVPEVDAQIDALRDLPFVSNWEFYFEGSGFFTYVIVLGALISTVCFHFFWSLDSAGYCRGGSWQGSAFYCVHVCFMIPVMLLLAMPIYVIADANNDWGLIAVEGLRGDPTPKELAIHLQEEYSELWLWLFRGEVSDQDFVQYADGAGAFFFYCLSLVVYGIAVLVRMPYHGRLPTADDLKSEMKGSWPTAPEEELRELDNLTPCQLLALAHVRRLCADLHQLAMPRLRARVRRMGYANEDLDRALSWIREEAPIIIHIKLEETAGRLTNDTHYRNQFQTNKSGGTLDHKKRKRWEDDLFGGAYEKATPFERVKYGSMNVINDPVGVRACAQYGSSYLLLKKCRLRTTFSAQDSAGLETKDLATVDYYGHVLMKYGDPELKEVLQVATGQVFGVQSDVLGTYKEAQIHGEVKLAEHIEIIMAHPSLRLVDDHRQAVQSLATRCNSQMVWIEGGIDLPPGAAVDRGGAASRGSVPPPHVSRPAAPSGAVEGAQDEIMVLVKGATGPEAANANGAYIFRPSGSSLVPMKQRVYAKVGDSRRCLFAETAEDYLRWRIGAQGPEAGGGDRCPLRSGPLSVSDGARADPIEASAWFSQTADGDWERQPNVKMISKKVTPGTAERLETARLPAGWDMATDARSGMTYYFNWETRLTTWERPTDGAPEEPVNTGSPSTASVGSDTPAESHQRDEVWQVEIDGSWSALTGQALVAIRSAQASGQEAAFCEQRGFRYELNLLQSVQRNLATGKTRRIRAVPSTGES